MKEMIPKILSLNEICEIQHVQDLLNPMTEEQLKLIRRLVMNYLCRERLRKFREREEGD